MQTLTPTDHSPWAPHRPTARRTAGRRALQVAAALVVLAIGATMVINGPGTSAAAADVLREAAEQLHDVESHRAVLVQTYADGEEWTFEGEFVGADGRQVATGRDAAGAVTATWELVAIDDTVWTHANGEVRVETVGPDERLHPLAESSVAVLDAALSSAEVNEAGQEPVRGVTADRYRIVLDEVSRSALAALRPGQLSWFALEDPADVDSIEVWVADGVVRRIEVRFVEGGTFMSSSTEFFDLGADITVTPPA